MHLVLHTCPMSSAIPVEIALAELDLPHERLVLDLQRGDQRAPAFLALNPNGKVPTLVVDGTPMFEGLAITQWLGDRFGVARGLWPAAETPERMVAAAWSTWAYVTYGDGLRRLNHARSPQVPAALHHAPLAEYTLAELDGLLAILDARLEGRPYVLGDAYSLVDVILGATAIYGTYCGVPVDAHPEVAAWVARLSERPAFRAHLPSRS